MLALLLISLLCPTVLAQDGPCAEPCVDPGPCAPPEAGCPAGTDAAAAASLGLLAPTQADLDVTLPLGWQDTTASSSDRTVTDRPYRLLDPADIHCPMDTQRKTDKQTGEYTRTFCALPDGRKKGPELLVYTSKGQRLYTEYSLDQEHGEHVITEADGRVMVQGRFELGLEEGEWQSWYVGGDRASRGDYHAGKKTGIWTEWSRDGVEKRCDYRDASVPDIQCVAPVE